MISQEEFNKLQKNISPYTGRVLTIPTEPCSIILEFDSVFEWLRPDYFIAQYAKNKVAVPAEFMRYKQLCSELELKTNERSSLISWSKRGIIPCMRKSGTFFYNPDTIIKWRSFFNYPNKTEIAMLVGTLLLNTEKIFVLIYHGTNKILLFNKKKDDVPRILGEYTKGNYVVGEEFYSVNKCTIHKATFDTLLPKKIVVKMRDGIMYYLPLEIAQKKVALQGKWYVIKYIDMIAGKLDD